MADTRKLRRLTLFDSYALNTEATASIATLLDFAASVATFAAPGLEAAETAATLNGGIQTLTLATNETSVQESSPTPNHQAFHMAANPHT